VDLAGPLKSGVRAAKAAKEINMTRKYIDCREYPSAMNCSVAISADNDEELLEAAVQHAVSVHQHQDTPELRQQLRQLFKEESSMEMPVAGRAGAETEAQRSRPT
jgi:predicted small metal-binding protein